MKNQKTITIDNLTQSDLNLLIMCAEQHSLKIKHRHNESLKITPTYEGPMVGQNIYDRINTILEKIR